VPLPMWTGRANFVQQHRGVGLWSIPPFGRLVILEVSRARYDAGYDRLARWFLIIAPRWRSSTPPYVERVRALSERVGDVACRPRITAVSPRSGACNAEQPPEARRADVLGDGHGFLGTGIYIAMWTWWCQIGSTRSINSFLQRVGRAGHSVRWDVERKIVSGPRELVECAHCSRRSAASSWTGGIFRRMPLTCSRSKSAEVAAREWSKMRFIVSFAARRLSLPLNLARQECLRMRIDSP